MQTLSSHNIKSLVEGIVNKILLEDTPKPKIDLSFLAVYETKFRNLQAKYNQFWKDGSMSLAIFYSIEQETEQAKDEYEGKQRKVIFTIDNSKEKFYYDNLEYYKEVESEMYALDKRIIAFSEMIDMAVRALRVIDEVEYSASLF